MNILAWVRKHPQRTAGLALTVIGGVQTNLVLFTDFIIPLANIIITTLFGVLVSALAWVKSNVPDAPLTEDTGDDLPPENMK
jgi:hypothetical protein